MAARYRQAAFFDLGDVVLYGKYKNKKGKVVSFGKNDKGQPTVTIEPIPKGRKKNKTMGLMKIWSLTKKQEALAEKQMKEDKAEAKKAADLRLATTQFQDARLAERVAARSKQARGLGRGQTEVAGSIRVHRYAESLRIWDLTNAGKRGKKVRVMSLGTSYAYKGDNQKWLDNVSYNALKLYDSYDGVKRFISDLQHDFPGEIDMDESTERGIDVLPADTKTIKMRWSVGTENLDLVASPLEFRVTSSHLFEAGQGHLESRPDAKSFRQDTSYWSRKKKDSAVFYSWVSANESQVKKMNIMALRALWQKMNVSYDSH